MKKDMRDILNALKEKSEGKLSSFEDVFGQCSSYFFLPRQRNRSGNCPMMLGSSSEEILLIYQWIHII